MVRKITIDIEYEQDPTVKLKKRQLERLIFERVRDRWCGEAGQQNTVNVSAVTIRHYDRFDF